MIFNLKGNYLIDFVYVNLFVEDKPVKILSPNVITKIKFYFLKQKISKKVKIISKSIYQFEIFELELLQRSILDSNNSFWDKLLDLIIIKEVANKKRVNEDYVDEVLKNFFYTIEEYQDNSNEIRELKKEKLSYMIVIDLIQTSVRYK